jgi:serine/threonine protein kinase HipA of HipAB toxin-antitoxin module
MINIIAIQLQFLLNQASLSVRFNIISKRMDANPQGNKRKVDGLPDVSVITVNFDYDRKVENIRDKIEKAFGMPFCRHCYRWF